MSGHLVGHRRPLRWLCGLLVLLLAGCEVRIHHGLEEREANELVAALQTVGITAQKVAESGRGKTWAVQVPADHQAIAVQQLNALGLPRVRREGMAQVFASGSMVPTPTEERLRESHLLAEQAVLALEQLEGVAGARVQLSLPAAARGARERPPAKASALVKVRPGALPQVSPMRSDIQELVAGGVDGLLAEDVAVVIQELQAPPIPINTPGDEGRASGPRVAALGALLLVFALFGVWMGQRRRPAAGSTKPAPIPTPARPRVASSHGYEAAPGEAETSASSRTPSGFRTG